MISRIYQVLLLKDLIILIYELNNYLKEETQEEYQDEITENKVDELMARLQRDNKMKEDKQKDTVMLKPNIQSDNIIKGYHRIHK